MKRIITILLLISSSVNKLTAQVTSYYLDATGHFVASTAPLSWQYSNLLKYWYYRYRLVNDFTCLGPNAGESLIAHSSASVTRMQWCGVCNATFLACQPLTDQQGRKARTESLPWLREQEQFSLQGLPAGVYFLSITNAGGQELAVQRVVKLNAE